MHPWLHQQQLSLSNRWRRWRENQPEGALHLLAAGIVCAVLVNPLVDESQSLDGALSPWADDYPLALGCAWALAAMALWWRPFAALRRELVQGMWCAQPQSAALAQRTLNRAVALAVATSMLACACIAHFGYAQHATSGFGIAVLAGGLGAALAGLLAGRAKPPPAKRSPAATAHWPLQCEFGDGMRRWQRLRVSQSWRTGTLSSSGLLLSGLVLPAGSSAAGIAAGLIALLLTVRTLVLYSGAAELVFSASRLFQGQPLAGARWRLAHARAVLPQGLLLSALIATCCYALGAPAFFALAVLLLLGGSALIEVELVARYRLRPRRRAIAWAVLVTAATALGPQAAPLIPVLLLAVYIYLRLIRTQ